MSKIVLIFSTLFIASFAQANAVKALKNYIPLYDHVGVNDNGQECSIDFYHRAGDEVLVELLMPRLAKFVIKPDMSFISKDHYFSVSQPSFAENNGMVTLSLVFEGADVKVERRFCLEERCWSSGKICQLEDWR